MGTGLVKGQTIILPPMYVICIAFLQMFPSSNSGPMALFLSPDALYEEGSHGFQIPALHLLAQDLIPSELLQGS